MNGYNFVKQDEQYTHDMAPWICASNHRINNDSENLWHLYGGMCA